MPGLPIRTANDGSNLWDALLDALQRVRSVKTDGLQQKSSAQPQDVADTLRELSTQLAASENALEAEAVERAREKVIDSPSFGGLGLAPGKQPTAAEYDEVLFLVEAWLDAVNSEQKMTKRLAPSKTKDSQTRPMTLAEKIFAQHVVGGCPVEGLKSGDVVRVSIDWIIASELSWSSMVRTHEALGTPSIWRNDRFWLAGDHVVHPQVWENPKIKKLVETSEKAKKDFKMTEYQGMNYTIMHTEFVRERAEPGMLCLGSDSHTCSGGAVGCLSIGLGAADVMMALSVGETWFKIPDSILIELDGTPSFGVSGKDVILYILKELKRNTVAGERIVEFTGSGLQHLSPDARFAIANMCTEFGAITGVFQPDAQVKDYISRRRRKANKENSIYFKADEGAEYAGKYKIDLTKIEPFIAKYPEPDHVVPLSEMAGLPLDGVFIGACTTTEEEIVLAGLVLQAGLKKGLPMAKGKRHYVPGSLPIVEKLRKLGLLEVYEAAGFTRGPPGCSYCVGLSAEKAEAGETWLSSQNRNFKNRMGAGAFGHVTTAVICAAASFSMSITDPTDLVAEIDVEFFKNYRAKVSDEGNTSVEYVEPGVRSASQSGSKSPEQTPLEPTKSEDRKLLGHIESRVVTLPDFVDTDALAPGPTLVSCETDEDFGKHVLEHTHPDFREKVKNGQRVVVAGNALGVGSSRQEAVMAMKGAGVKAVIARSFAFIYGRNQPSLGLLGFTMSDERFYELAKDGAHISIDVDARSLEVGGHVFKFQLSEIEYALTANKGVTDSFKKYGKEIWSKIAGGGHGPTKDELLSNQLERVDSRMEW